MGLSKQRLLRYIGESLICQCEIAWVDFINGIDDRGIQVILPT